jgi:hypothetical protein
METTIQDIRDAMMQWNPTTTDGQMFASVIVDLCDCIKKLEYEVKRLSKLEEKP